MGVKFFTSSTENTIAIQWNYGLGDGQIVLTQYNFEGELECLFVNVQINEVPATSIESSRGFWWTSVGFILIQLTIF